MDLRGQREPDVRSRSTEASQTFQMDGQSFQMGFHLSKWISEAKRRRRRYNYGDPADPAILQEVPAGPLMRS